MRGSQATRRLRAHIVVRQLAVDLGTRGQLVAVLQGKIVDRLAAVGAPAGAVDAGIEHCQAETVIELAADEGAVLAIGAAGLGVIVGAHGGVAIEARLDRNRAGLEIDDAADVLRAEADRAGAAHDVDRFDVVQADRCKRQLRLAIRRDRQRNPVEQYRGARREAPRQATHADIQRHGTACGTGVVAHLYAGNTAHHVADAGSAGILDIFFLDHGTRAGIALDAVLQAGA